MVLVCAELESGCVPLFALNCLRQTSLVDVYSPQITVVTTSALESSSITSDLKDPSDGGFVSQVFQCTEDYLRSKVRE